MRKNIVWTGFLLFSVACGSNPSAPSNTTKDSNGNTSTSIESTQSTQWPVGDGRYGWENPSYPPPTCACPSGYSNHYNGWNFVCENPRGLRVFPHLSNCSK